MKHFPKVLFLIGFLLLFASAKTTYAQTEDCYMPVRPPGVDDKKNFIEQVSKLAVEAEKKHSIPAPVIAGMAILESGYGLTRLSIDANNIFGYKKVSGRTSYRLTCQPSWDQGNEYVKFDSLAEAVDFVANRLATSQYYRPDTATYKAEITAGVDRKTAAINWLIGISNPYNYAPNEYVDKVKKCINDPYNWSAGINETTNLWKLSSVSSSSSASTNIQTKLAEVEKIYADKIATGGRYMESQTGCTTLTQLSGDDALNKILQPYFDYLRLNHLDLKIQDCKYRQGLGGRVIMLNVDAKQLARWTVNACQSKNFSSTCLQAVVDHIWGSNNTQFPITGTVTEESLSNTDCTPVKHGVPALYAFRDGVTVRLKSFRLNDLKGASCTNNQLDENQLKAVLTEPIVSTADVIRIAAVSAAKTSHSEYLNFARNSYLEALGKDEYKILKSWVKENKDIK